ncbi:MAG TPA: zinc-binding dehydrogenase [Solirubrobacteraceae bacterium]|jgi:Zn-dependent alcohol dehydrogenase|nr:zinc-binding dehydrogenase [Solirubrobacteraceae bacterium]
MTQTALLGPVTPTALEMRACVLREPGVAPAVERVLLEPPHAGEVLVRIAAAGVCHSDIHLVDGQLGPGRWPMVLGHEGAGVIEAVGEGVVGLAPGDHVVFCMVASCGVCHACRSGRRTLCEPVGVQSLAGKLPDGTSRLTSADGTSLQHGLTVACFAEYAVVAAAGAVAIPHDVPLWQAALLGCSVVTGFGAVAHAARVRIGERVAVIGCGGVGLQVIAAARLAGAATIIAVDRRPEKLEHARRRGATEVIDAGTVDAAAAIGALTGGGVDHAFEVVGTAATIRTAWDAVRPGGTAVVVGLAPRGIEVSLPAIEFLSEKSIIGSYYGTADPAQSFPGLVELVRSGRLELADMVSHLIDLEGVPGALERLRRGEGNRSVIVVDHELAGAEATLAA